LALLPWELAVWAAKKIAIGAMSLGFFSALDALL
jgi:hypothetical protein